MYSSTLLISFITISTNKCLCRYTEIFNNDDGDNNHVFRMKLIATCIDDYMDYIFVFD